MAHTIKRTQTQSKYYTHKTNENSFPTSPNERQGQGDLLDVVLGQVEDLKLGEALESVGLEEGDGVGGQVEVLEPGDVHERQRHHLKPTPVLYPASATEQST